MGALAAEMFSDQVKLWPPTGRHILAQYDDDTIILYQAYRPSIGHFAVRNGVLGGEFSFTRMSWVKTNFLWMMYRSGWGTKKDQEMTLGLRVRRAFFDALLAQAVPSNWNCHEFATKEDWMRAVDNSSVRLQWDPDHDPFGAPLGRRAIQLGLRDEVLRAFAQREILEILDLSTFVAEQRAILMSRGVSGLVTPLERVYRPFDSTVAARLGLS